MVKIVDRNSTKPVVIAKPMSIKGLGESKKYVETTKNNKSTSEDSEAVEATAKTTRKRTTKTK